MEQPFDTEELATLHKLACNACVDKVAADQRRRRAGYVNQTSDQDELAHLEQLEKKLRDILIPPEIEQYD